MIDDVPLSFFEQLIQQDVTFNKADLDKNTDLDNIDWNQVDVPSKLLQKKLPQKNDTENIFEYTYDCKHKCPDKQA